MCVRACVCVCVCVREGVCMCVHVCVYVCASEKVCVCVCMHVCVYVCMYVCVHVCMCVCVHVCSVGQCTCTSVNCRVNTLVGLYCNTNNDGMPNKRHLSHVWFPHTRVPLSESMTLLHTSSSWSYEEEQLMPISIGGSIVYVAYKPRL